MNNLMIDLETMGNKPNAPIVSIGAVFFEPETGEIGPELYTAVDLKSEVALGAAPDADTILWWLTQSSEARAAITGDALPIRDALSASVLLPRLTVSRPRICMFGEMVPRSITLFFVRPMSAARCLHAGVGSMIWMLELSLNLVELLVSILREKCHLMANGTTLWLTQFIKLNMFQLFISAWYRPPATISINNTARLRRAFK